MIRILRATLAATGAFWENMCPGPNVAGYRLDSPASWTAGADDDDPETLRAFDFPAEEVPDVPPHASTEPSAGIHFGDWVLPVVVEVLAMHRPSDNVVDDAVDCLHADGTRCGCYWTLQGWSKHVAQLVAERLESAWAAEQRRQADQRVTRQLAAAGFKAGEDFAAAFSTEDYGRTTTCVHCHTMIRVDVDDNPYHVATGFYPCADKKHYATAGEAK